MAGTSEGARKTAQKLKAKDPDYFKKMGTRSSKVRDNASYNYHYKNVEEAKKANQLSVVVRRRNSKNPITRAKSYEETERAR